MRVVLYTYNFPPALGGMATLHRQYAQALFEAGHEIEVHVWGRAAHPGRLSIRGVPLLEDSVSGNRGIPRLEDLVSNHRGDEMSFPFPVTYHRTPALLAHIFARPRGHVDLTWFSYGEPMLLKAVLAPRRPFFIFAGGRIFEHTYHGWKARWRQAIVRDMLRKARGICTDGEDVKREMIEHGIPEDKIVLLYSGVDTTLFSPTATTERFEQWLTSQGKALPARPRLLFLGRVAEENGPLDFLRLLRELPDCTAFMLGDGPRLSQVLVEAARLGSRVLVAGRLDHDVLPSALSAADLCVFPLGSLHGGIPLSVMEAMAVGRACVAYRVGDLSRLIDGENGRLAPCGDFAALLSEVRGLLADETRRTAMGRRAAESIASAWTLPAAQRRFVAQVERWACL